ncbi:hypothetical protein RCOM_0602860 [Ricinus communis]|uniref:AB hydrolase-1 domain-containing protein n=1 Tax=Ricinus communis TaxID=3988 RepID=B9S8M8_RICCO|nr:hypothetical protein RCOM_0602860 [Ricinus communis]
MLIRPYPLFSDDAIEREVVFTKERYGSVPRVYVVCGQDNIVNEDLQRWVVQSNPPDWVKIIPDSDHMVMFSKPQEFCSCLEEIANKYMNYLFRVASGKSSMRSKFLLNLCIIFLRKDQ